MLPGFSAVSGLTAGAAALTACPANNFRAGTVAYNAGSGNPCTSCPSGMQTLPGVQGATSGDACLAPPGWGWSAVTQTATICPVGTVSGATRCAAAPVCSQHLPCI